MSENLKNNPIITNDQKNPDKSYQGETPFISVHPETEERKEVATADEDVANRLTRARRTGQSVKSITAPPPTG